MLRRCRWLGSPWIRAPPWHLPVAHEELIRGDEEVVGRLDAPRAPWTRAQRAVKEELLRVLHTIFKFSPRRNHGAWLRAQRRRPNRKAIRAQNLPDMLHRGAEAHLDDKDAAAGAAAWLVVGRRRRRRRNGLISRSVLLAAPAPAPLAAVAQVVVKQCVLVHCSQVPRVLSAKAPRRVSQGWRTHWHDLDRSSAAWFCRPLCVAKAVRRCATLPPDPRAAWREQLPGIPGGFIRRIAWGGACEHSFLTGDPHHSRIRPPDSSCITVLAHKAVIIYKGGPRRAMCDDA